MNTQQWLLWAPRPSRVFRLMHSRARPLDIDVETAEDIVREYGMKPVGGHRNLPMGGRNRNVVVNTDAGKKVLKLYRPKWPLDTVRCEHSILRRLAELDLPAPRPALARSGETWVIRPSGTYAMSDYIAGRSISAAFITRAARLRLAALAGQALARIHRELRGFVPAGKHHLGFVSYEGDRRRDTSWYRDRIAHLKAQSRQLPRGRAGEHIDHLAGAGAYIAEELYRLDELLRHAALPRSVIHGDYGFHNLLFRDPASVTVMDFELARLEWRLGDLVSAVSRFHASGRRGMEPVRCFFSGYQSEYPVTGEEWRLFADVWKYNHLRAAVQFWNSCFESGGGFKKLLQATRALSEANRGSDVANELGSPGGLAAVSDSVRAKVRPGLTPQGLNS